MPAEAVAGIAEAIVPLVGALAELVIVLIQLAAVVVEILVYLVIFLVELAARSFTKEPHTPHASLTDKIKATMQKRFGGHGGPPGSDAESGKTSTLWNPYSPAPTPPFRWERRHTAALLIWLAVFAVILIAIGLVWGRRFDITVIEAELQQVVAGTFPKSQTVFRVVEATVHSPVVKLDDRADRITVTLECMVKVHGVPGTARGTLMASGRLEYRPRDGAFYFTDVVIDRIDLVGVPDQWEQKAHGAAGALAREVLERFPVYRLKEDRWKDRAAKLVLRRVRVEHNVLVLTMGVG